MANDKLDKVSSAVERLRQSLAPTDGDNSLAALATARADAGATMVLLLDCSSSMSTVMTSGESRFAALRKMVNELAGSLPTVRTIIFPAPHNPYGAAAVEAPLPERANGETPLHAAFDLAREIGARRVAVLTDGEPGDQATATDAAVRLAATGAVVSLFYIGEPGGYGAMYLDTLAKRLGSSFERDGQRMLGGARAALTSKVHLALTGRRA